MKVFIYSELHFFEVTFYKIPTFVSTCHMMLSQSKIANTCSFCRIYKIYIFTKPAFIVIETFYKKIYKLGFVILLCIVPLSDIFTQNICALLGMYLLFVTLCWLLLVLSFAHAQLLKLMLF